MSTSSRLDPASHTLPAHPMVLFNIEVREMNPQGRLDLEA